MAGIDNNTLLYLRGDSFDDLSLNPKSIENTNTIVQEGFFGKYIDFNSNSYVKLPVEVFKSILNNQEFTIEYYYYENNKNFQSKYTISSWGNK